MKKKLKISVGRESSKEVEPQIEVKAPVVDRLVYVLPWNVGLQFAQNIPDEVKMRVEKEVESGKAAYLPSKGSNYRLSLRLNLPDEASARISLGATRVSQKGGLRIDITPSKMSGAAIKAMHKTIRRLLDLEREEYRELRKLAMVNRMDVAVDVGVRLDRLLVGYRGAHELTVFGKRFKHAAAETFNFGSVSSAYRAAVYDKGVQLTHELVRKLRKAGEAEDLKSILVRQVRGRKQGRPITRFEVRGMKMGGLRLYELVNHHDDRFNRFELVDMSALEGLSPFVQACFGALAREVGVLKAVKVYQDCDDKALRKVIKKLTDASPDWWQPDGLWAQAVEGLKQMKIFPRSAFLDPRDC